MPTCTSRPRCRQLAASKPSLAASIEALRRDLEASHRQAMARLEFLLTRAAEAEREAIAGRR
jgi:hypothetical protein